MLRRVLRTTRIVLLLVLVAMAIGALIARNWGLVIPAIVLIALLAFVEALERGYIGGDGGRKHPGA